MKNLPSEARTCSADALAQLNATGRYTIYEPCNCGDRPRHSNGGNYHEIIDLALDGGRLYIRRGDTCELTPAPEWEETDETPAAIFERYADWL